MVKQLNFIDLFAGIGGFRIALEKTGAKCVFSSEWDKFAQITYKENFGEIPKGDITNINEKEIKRSFSRARVRVGKISRLNGF